MHTYRHVFGLLSAALLMAAVIHPLAASDQPNIVVILVDDLGYGDLTSYGSKDLETPHIDRLLAAGMRFENAYANCPVCSPTRASLLTGRYPEEVGVPGVIRTHAESNWGYFDPSAVTLPDVLAKAGYDTAIVGKWHLGLESPNTPNERGFRHFHGFLGDMMDDYYKHRRHGIPYMRLNDKLIQPEGHATDLFSKWASEYIESRQGMKQPFFLYLAYNAPHTPIQPPADWLAKYKEKHPDVSNQRAKLASLIEHMDDGIGRVLATIEKAGMTDDTIVFFTSDNGGQSNVGANNGPWRDGKQSMYEGGLRVPMGVRWPGHIGAATSTARRTMTMDIFPTCADLAVATIEHEIDGISFLPHLLGEAPPEKPRDLYFHRREGGTRYGGLVINAVIRGEWKLLQNSPFEPQELYNLEVDPAETTDLSAKNPAKFRELAAALREQVQQGGRIPWQKPATSE